MNIINIMMRQNYSLFKLGLLIICYSIIVLFYSCSSSETKKNVDISKIDVEFKSIRFDEELFACDTNRLLDDINALGNKYPDFAAVYFNEVTGFGASNDPKVLENSIHDFISHKDYKGMMDTVRGKFPNTVSIDKDLKNLFKHVKYYFPKQPIGDVYYFVSGLNRWSAITVDSNIGVGLDMHLGKAYPYYASVQIPQYQLNRCEPEYIPINVAKTMYDDKYPMDPTGKNLLELMISKGKQLLFAEYCLPETSDEMLIGYSKEQLAWCKENESMIWHYFSKQKLTYSTQWQEILRYVNDGPNSTGMPPESPGNIGSWIGWQLVRTYLKNNPNKTIVDVFNDNSNGLNFLRTSGYKP